MIGKIGFIIAAIIGLILLYFFLYPLFVLAVLIFILYLIFRIYSWIQRLRTPKGMRIKHGLMRNYLENKYGKKEGKGIYTEIVNELKGKGYR